MAEDRIIFAGAGVDLVGDAAGPPDGPTILFLHGSGQTRHSWREAVREAAERGFRAVAIDLRGHGESGWSPDGIYTLERFTDDARAVIDQIGGKPIVVGASLGGSVAMIIAAQPDPPLSALVLVDITARVEREGAMEVHAFMGSAQHGFASLDEAADAVSAYLPHRRRPEDTSGLARNLRLRDGRYYWHWDPGILAMGEAARHKMDNQSMMIETARALRVPTLLIRGGKSRIVTKEGAREFLELVPHADFVDIQDADHMVAGDDNDAFNAAVFAFVDQLSATAAESRVQGA